MASIFNFSTTLVTLAILSTLLLQGTLGGLTCEQLSKEDCAFAVSNTGKRCVLEKYVRRSGMEAYKCTTSAIEADKLKDLVETNHCIEACGLDRDTIGISSDSLLESHFTRKLCSPQCYRRCPNIVDLYFNLAAGEGVFLPKLCAKQGGKHPRRGMSEIKSSEMGAPGPVSGIDAANFVRPPTGSPIESLDLGLDMDTGIPPESGAPIGSPIESLDLSLDVDTAIPPESGAPIGSPIESLDLGLDMGTGIPPEYGAPIGSPIESPIGSPVESPESGLDMGMGIPPEYGAPIGSPVESPESGLDMDMGIPPEYGAPAMSPSY